MEVFRAKTATNTKEVIDSEVQSSLLWIKARIETIVKKFCVGKSRLVHRDEQEFAILDAEWTRKANDIVTKGFNKDECMIYWIRSKVYQILERDIFNARVFGLDDEMEKKMAEFEERIAFHNSRK